MDLVYIVLMICNCYREEVQAISGRRKVWVPLLDGVKSSADEVLPCRRNDLSRSVEYRELQGLHGQPINSSIMATDAHKGDWQIF